MEEVIDRKLCKRLKSVHAIQTDREISSNRISPMWLRAIKGNNCLLIDISVPTDDNKSVKVYYKISKKRPDNRNGKNWHLKLPLPSNSGMIKKGINKRMNKIPGISCLHEIQTNALCGIALLPRRVQTI